MKKKNKEETKSLVVLKDRKVERNILEKKKSNDISFVDDPV